jgi:phosphate transport system substrate-binding protein
MVGSDLMGPAFRTTLERWADEGGAVVSLDLRGTRLARDDLAVGEAELAVLVTPDRATPLPADWLVLPLAYHVAVAVAAPESPISQLDLTQLREIYGAGTPGVTRWGDLGAAGEWAGWAVQPVMTGPRLGLAHELMRHRILQTIELKPTVTVLDEVETLSSRVRATPGGLGIGPVAPGDLKTLLLAAAPGEIAFGPSPENVHAGDYPIRVPVKLVLPRRRAAEQWALLRFLLGDEMAAALHRDGLVPLPQAVRRQLVFDLEEF